MSGAMKVTTILLILFSLVASGCDDMKVIKIAADENNPPTFKMSGSPVNDLFVYDEKGRVVWEIHREAQVESITATTYGQLPTGYKETVHPERLVEGQTYVVKASVANPHVVPGELRFTVGKPSQAGQ